MNPKQNPADALFQIRSLMERSTRFLSLSGLSGIVAGVVSLMGLAMVYVFLDIVPFERDSIYYLKALDAHKWGLDSKPFFVLDALLVVLVAAIGCTYFTYRKARRQGQNLFDALTKRLLINFLVPLGVGGIFCLALLDQGYLNLLAPSTLIFYGLALLNTSKFTFDEIRYLAYLEIGLGLLGLFFLKYGLELWGVGFGILHIIYGVIFYNKYDK